MKIEQIYTGCLAQGAYYITSGNEAAIIDPLRETQPYLDCLERDNVKLRYIFETHFHADFVSGHVDLANKTGAGIIYGPNASADFKHISAADGQEFPLGTCRIRVLYTPGHTIESTTFLLIDENGKDHAIFSGDTLFIGDVERPDLAQKAAAMTREQLAATLYNSIRTKIMTLPDDVIVYPAHGAGSACGKNISKETVSTIGEQKRSNYALRADMSESEFVKEVTDGLLPPPSYFGMNVAMNKSGIASFESVFNQGMRKISAIAFEAVVKETGALILDARPGNVFCHGFVPRSINIGIDGDFAPWVGTLIADVNQPVILVTEPGFEEESVTRLSRVGFDNIVGHLDGGFEAWKNAGYEIDTVYRIAATAFAENVKLLRDKVIDVRKESEYEAGHVEEAYCKPLAYINEWIKDINPEEHFYLHCAGGYRSMIAASILQARGYRDFTEVEGGFNAIATTNLSQTGFICQGKTLK